MYEITVGGWFSAAHQLRLPDGRVEPLHGHNWRVDVTFVRPALDESGLVLDFVAVKRGLDAALAGLHDTNLNELPAFAVRNPSTENVCVYLAERLAGLATPPARLECVEVEEAPGCVARYRSRGGGGSAA